MDNEQARFLLSAARADGADTSDPRMAEALEQARRDPELARWLAAERAFDAAVVRKLQLREPPASLRARLLAGGRAGQRPRRGTHRAWWIGIAAAIALATSTAIWWPDRPSGAPAEIAARPPLLEWQQSCLAIFNDPDFALDLMDANYPSLEKYLVDHGTRLLPKVPFAPGAVGLVGCKALAWREQPVSFLCFKAATGELVHLFVVPRGTADESLLATGPHRAAVGEFATVTWIQGDLVALVASKMPPERLDHILDRDVAAAPAPGHQRTTLRVASR